MAILKFYNPTVHDIHTYSPAATRFPRVDGQQIGFNPSCQGVSIDWSGVSLRPRAFARDFTANNPYYQYFLNTQYVADSINFWNTTNPCAVLISPRHALICEHYRGPGRPVGEYEAYTFLGKSGTYHTHKLKKVTFSIGYNGSDHTLLEFETQVDTSDVAAYSIADVGFIPQGRDIWIHDCQGRAYKMSMLLPRYGNDPSVTIGFGYVPILDGVNNGAAGPTQDPYIWGGDSGSPAFIFDEEGNTIFVGLLNGGEQVNILEIAAINQELSEYGYETPHFQFGQGGGGTCLGSCQSNITINFNNPTISSPFKSSLYPYIIETNSEIPSVNLTLQNYQRANNTNRFILSRYSRDSAHTDWYLYYLQSISSTLGKIQKQSETTTRNPIVAVPAIRTHYKKDESQYYPNQYFTP